jgi:chromosome segregation protein
VLESFIDRSQFIIVTHSKRTMARADIMYGVTMEEFGVSKPVGMKLTDANADPAGADTDDNLSAAAKAARRIDG